MKNYILLIILLVFLISCSDIELPMYNTGDLVVLKDGRSVIIDKQIPAGYVVYSVTKYQVTYFQISNNDIKK